MAKDSHNSKHIRISCECGKTYHLPIDAAGKRAKCPCGRVFTISVSPTKGQSRSEETEAKLKDLEEHISEQNEKSKKTGIEGASVNKKANQIPSQNQVAQTQSLVSCFFCSKKPSDDDSVCLVHVYQVLRTVGTNIIRDLSIVVLGGVIGGFQPGKIVLFRKRVVKVPRCEHCKMLHESRKHHEGRFLGKGAICGAIAGSVIAIIAIYYFGKLKTMATKLLAIVFTAIWGATCGAGLGWVVGSLNRPRLGDTKSEMRAQESPNIKQMLANGWYIGDSPGGSGGEQFIEIPPEKEKEVMDSIEG